MHVPDLPWLMDKGDASNNNNTYIKYLQPNNIPIKLCNSHKVGIGTFYANRDLHSLLLGAFDSIEGWRILGYDIIQWNESLHDSYGNKTLAYLSCHRSINGHSNACQYLIMLACMTDTYRANDVSICAEYTNVGEEFHYCNLSERDDEQDGTYLRTTCRRLCLGIYLHISWLGLLRRFVFLVHQIWSIETEALGLELGRSGYNAICPALNPMDGMIWERPVNKAQ